MFSFKPIYFVIFALILCKSEAKISDKRLCVDVSCSELVSVGKTLLRYASPEENVLSFVPNEDVKVYSHGAGDRPDLIGVEIKGKRGYINKNHFRETRLIKRPKLLVDTEIVNKKPEVPLEGAATDIKADPTRQPFEVVDGTRIPLDYIGSSTESPAVNSDNVQGIEATTKPLDSVPQNQNVHPTIPKESLLVNTKEDKNTGEQSQQQNNLDTKEDVDSDDEDDDDDDDEDDESDGNDEEDETENKDEVQNKADIVLPSDNAGNVSYSGTLETEKKAMINEVKDVDKESNKDSKFEFISPGEETGVVNSTNGLNEPSSNILDNSKINTETVETIQKSPEAGTIDGSSPLVNISAVQKYDIEENKDISENKSDKTKEQNDFDKSQGLPVSSTENPIEIEAIPPINLDVVTPNPINSQNINEIIEEVKNNTEDIITPSHSLPSDLMPEFKDPPESGEVKVEEKGGWGLGTILPMFSSGGGSEASKETDKQVNEGNQGPTENEPSQKSVAVENTDVPLSGEEGVQNIEPIVDDTVVSISTKQNGLSETQNSDIFVQNNETVVAEVAENAPETFQQDSLPENLNFETSEQDKIEEIGSSSTNKQLESSGGFLSNIFGGGSDDDIAKNDEKEEEVVEKDHDSAASFILDAGAQDLNQFNEVNTDNHNPWLSNNSPEENIDDNGKVCYNLEENQNCPKHQEEFVDPPKEKILGSISIGVEDLQIKFIEVFSSDLFLYLTTTALSVIFLVFGMVILDKCRRERPLIARINKLEQQLLTTIKENEMLQEKNTSFVEEKTQLVVETVPNEVVEELNQKLAEMALVKLSLEEQIEALQKELDTTTEVGIELNKILSEMLNSSGGGEILKENIEQMQKKLMEQQDTINTINETLSLKETENHELKLEMEINNGRVIDLQGELDRMVEKIIKIEEERDQQHSTLENDILVYQNKYREALSKEHDLNNEIQVVKQQLVKVQRIADVKVKEYNTLKESLTEIKSMKNNKDALKSLLQLSEIKAQMEQFKSENLKYSEQLKLEREAIVGYGAKIESLTQELNELREKYDKADQEKLEINTKLQVLNNYFKEKEEQMQKEISKYESLWVAKEGEATSTTERIGYMQEELQNYKAQNESLKQEIVNQEVELKSQISMLEKKAHESWVANRQTERKLEEARQEAAQLRNRLTLRERAIAEGNNQARIQSPLHQNGELPFSPPPLDATQSPPPAFFNPRDHITKSPPIPGMPPFLPPPLGASTFIPPPPLDGPILPMGDMGAMPPPFMPPLPPGMFPGDHRPPPLGRMSSPPPVGGRYTPESNAYSDYDRYSRRSPSPPYDSEYGASPPPIRGYSPYQDRLRDDRREYKRPQARSNGRNSKGMQSSGSENDSLGKINKKPPRKV